jgi:NADH:flavin oxidoreductase / NADH oxidase family
MQVNAAIANRPARAEQPFKPLFLPYRLGNIELNNRLVMAPMTRSRAVERNVPNPIAAIYYAQRASAGRADSRRLGHSATVLTVYSSRPAELRIVVAPIDPGKEGVYRR